MESHCGNKAVVYESSFYLHNGIFYAGKPIYFHKIPAGFHQERSGWCNPRNLILNKELWLASL